MTEKPSALESFEVAVGTKIFRCNLARASARKLKICVFPDQRVLVTAPRRAPIEDVVARTKKKASWIIRQIDYFEKFQPIQPPKQFLSGETHLFQGRQYRLRITPSNRFSIDVEGRHIVVRTKLPEKRSHIRSMMDRWYFHSARRVLRERFEVCWRKFRHNKVPRPRVRFCRMKNRWGSCTKSGTITLNRDMIRAPIPCVDYAIMHELCHLLENNHSDAFYSHLRRTMPDWEARKQHLDMSMAHS